jgi:hypothetical protein
LWDNTDPRVVIPPHREVEQIITARYIKLGAFAKIAGCICETLEMDAQSTAKMVYAEKSVDVGAFGEIEHLFRVTGCKLITGAHSEVPFNPIWSRDRWESEARKFRGF